MQASRESCVRMRRAHRRRARRRRWLKYTLCHPHLAHSARGHPPGSRPIQRAAKRTTAAAATAMAALPCCGVAVPCKVCSFPNGAQHACRPLAPLGLQKLKDAGFGSSKLESGWQRDIGKETSEVGQVLFVPRQA